MQAEELQPVPPPDMEECMRRDLRYEDDDHRMLLRRVPGRIKGSDRDPGNGEDSWHFDAESEWNGFETGSIRMVMNCGEPDEDLDEDKRRIERPPADFRNEEWE